MVLRDKKIECIIENESIEKSKNNFIFIFFKLVFKSIIVGDVK